MSHEFQIPYTQDRGSQAFTAGETVEVSPIHPDIKKSYRIADSILGARKYRLDSEFIHPTSGEYRNSFVRSVAKAIFSVDGSSLGRPKQLTEAILRDQESKIGSTIFGDKKPNERREFFLDQRIANLVSWFFHQEITDAKGSVHKVTLHYEVRPEGVLRISSHPSTPNTLISGQELANFLTAIEVYHDLVVSQMYPNHGRAEDRLAA